MLWLVLSTLSAAPAAPAKPAAAALDVAFGIQRLYPELEALYLDLHKSPELSFQEKQTAAKMSARLRGLGYEVSEGVGGLGVVGVLKNGSGPTVLLRTELDGLPVEEKTGLPYASHVKAVDELGRQVSVMHACGHDVHMTGWVGAATLLAQAKASWRGTLLMVAQPAEERVGGARAMVADGLFKRFPRPDFAVAVHTKWDLPAGSIGYAPGFALANVDSVDVTLYGRGGHGSLPEATIDPIVMAARVVLALQTIVSREVSPLDAAVITVGSLHAGTKHNIIPDEAKLQITVRSYEATVRAKLLAGIERVAKGEAAVSGAPREPTLTVSDSSDATYNDPVVGERLRRALIPAVGAERFVDVKPVMGAEDFSELGKAAGAPSVMLWVGVSPQARWAAYKAGRDTLPSNHSAEFAPDRRPSLETATRALTEAALELLGKP